MSEKQLKTKQGLALFQQEIDGLPAPDPSLKSPPVELPVCPQCQRDGLRTERVAAPNGVWACARGHGLLEVGRHQPYTRRR